MREKFRISLDMPLNGRQPKKHNCPSCGKKRFVRYIYTDSGQYLPAHYGRCDREESCGYWLQPEKSFYHDKQYSGFHAFSKEAVESTFRDYHQNSFVQFLTSVFGGEMAMEAVNNYQVGTIGESTAFWQIDFNGFARSAKIINYNPITGKRKPGTNWYHSLMNRQGFNLIQCFFGEHLVKASDTVAIVESEKTAIIASLAMPHYTWIACGSKNGMGGHRTGLKTDKCEFLAERDIILFPDLTQADSDTVSCFDLWTRIGVSLERELGCSVLVFDEMEKNASDQQRADQWDIADFIIEDLKETIS